MGWTGYTAMIYKRNGEIDRKAELDHELFHGSGDGCHKLLKSTMVGSVYYAAARSPRGHVYGLVVLTRSDRSMKNGCNFFYKDMSEDMGPCYYDCPASILDMLSETDNEYALNWRTNCRKQLEQKKSPTSLSKLPIGARIQFSRADTVVTLEKHAPAYQFKHPFWYNRENNTYMPKTRIPDNYQVVSM